jgi:hypothetical protein
MNILESISFFKVYIPTSLCSDLLTQEGSGLTTHEPKLTIEFTTSTRDRLSTLTGINTFIKRFKAEHIHPLITTLRYF